jgi:hypothetical protein
MAKATRLVRPRTVTGDGEGLCRRRGWWLGEVADRSGLTAGFGPVLATVPRRCHDPGVCFAAGPAPPVRTGAVPQHGATSGVRSSRRER